MDVSSSLYSSRYPIGSFSYCNNESSLSQKEQEIKIAKALKKIAKLPEKVRNLVSSLKPSELNYIYREGGWNISQVVHHLADSHLHSYLRFKLALTENVPTIKPYREDLWNELGDIEIYLLNYSLDLLESLHKKWILLLKSLSYLDWQKRFYHPEEKCEVTLVHNAAFYAWHGEHHLAHIKLALQLKTAKINVV